MISRESFTPEEPYTIYEDISFNEVEEPYKYIFLRIYNPVYKNPLYFANFLKAGINATEVSEYTASHSSIGFSLEDTFYGLSGTGHGRLKIEHCTNIVDHPYMKSSDPQKSDQLTMAIKVRESEYNNIKADVEKAYEDPEFTYNVIQNFKIAPVAMNRKFFAKKENKQFGSIKYPKRKYNPNKKERFVCCTYISYLLITYVPEFKQWFEEHKVDYHLLTVTDLIFLPYSKKLFYSSWDDYDLAVEAFVSQYPDFLPYLNN